MTDNEIIADYSARFPHTVSMDFLTTMHGETRKKAVQKLKKALETGEPTNDIEISPNTPIGAFI